MRKCGLMLVVVALLLATALPVAKSQPGSAEDTDARAKLGTLEKRLPEVIAKLEKREETKIRHSHYFYRAKPRLVRRTSQDKVLC